MERCAMPNHPDLTKKLKLLYQLRVNPKISTNTELAAEFGITKQAVSRWIHGSETSAGDRVPLSQLRKLANLFEIKLHWFALPYEEFEEFLFQKLESRDISRHGRPDRISISQLPVTSVDVFGREQELDSLNAAWRQPDTNVVQLIAFGGVGKSCLINYWLSSLNDRNYLGARQVYAWSFYWQGASSDIQSTGDFFIEHALDWFGDSDSSKGTPRAKASRRAKPIRQSRKRLILEGMDTLASSSWPATWSL